MDQNTMVCYIVNSCSTLLHCNVPCCTVVIYCHHHHHHHLFYHVTLVCYITLRRAMQLLAGLGHVVPCYAALRRASQAGTYCAMPRCILYCTVPNHCFPLPHPLIFCSIKINSKRPNILFNKKHLLPPCPTTFFKAKYGSALTRTNQKCYSCTSVSVVIPGKEYDLTVTRQQQILKA